MASPQKENGYTPISNELFEALCRTRIAGEARQVLDVIIRKTYGFNKKSDCISLSQFVSFTGLSKPTVCKSLNRLKSMKIITQKANDVANEYSIIKDYLLWEPLPKKIMLPKKPTTITQKANNRYPKSDIQKTITKDTITKDTMNPEEIISPKEDKSVKTRKIHDLTGFETFWAVFPKKVDKAGTSAIWGKLSKDDKEAALADVPLRAHSEVWTKEEGKYILSPRKYLEGHRWEDEMKAEKNSYLKDKYAKYGYTQSKGSA